MQYSEVPYEGKAKKPYLQLFQKGKKSFSHYSKEWTLVIDKYKVIGVLGQGGYGQVFDAINRKSGEKVAIKLIEIQERKGSYFVRKLLREIIILRKLSEMKDNVFTNRLLEIILPPDVVKPKKSINLITGKAEKFESLHLNNMTHVFLILEKSDRDLKSLVELSPNINEEHVIVMLYNILCSLKFIHSTGVIHRDLKPSNILVDCDSRIQICDFGLSRCLPKNSDIENQLKEAKKNPMIHSSSLKERNHFKDSMRQILKKTRAEKEQQKREMSPCIQTRWYRSPEIILTEKTYNESVDIWSAGLVLGELMRCTE